ncbi:hypothetical protein TRAPUB_3563 [Trametes pubescens]|uniref:Uncharacterized protein n=1 Tax=Trametes pubescens TaxID=154538 RepID=A0A1M2VDH1_TRAPU|nr:hypothetical protein TRAPUB_3563 [Trametes pubescens]
MHESSSADQPYTAPDAQTLKGTDVSAASFQQRPTTLWERFSINRKYVYSNKTYNSIQQQHAQLGTLRERNTSYHHETAVPEHSTSIDEQQTIPLRTEEH